MTTLAVVAARGGSKGLPGKNIRPFHDVPLLAVSIRQARASSAVDAVVVSSDDSAYLAIGANWGADAAFARPAALAEDRTPKLPVLRHVIETFEAQTGRRVEVLIDLQPTSPLRRPADINGAAAKLGADASLMNVVSACEAKASPYYTLVELDAQNRAALSKPPAEAAFRRQDIPECFALNGSIYAWRRASVFESASALTPRTGLWVMPPETAFDIDSGLDFDLAEFVAGRWTDWREGVDLGPPEARP